jgi:hypothetical protein
MRRSLLCAQMTTASLLASSCVLFTDNATRLAYDVERGAAALRTSNETAMVLQYRPIGRDDQPYSIQITQSRRAVRVDAFGNIDAPGGSGVTVSGDHPGSTGYHERFVFVPRALKVAKTGGPTEIVLSKVGDRIELVELR